MEKKYIMAQINIPIEILPDGQTRHHIRCAQIEFLPCDHLPTEHDNPNQFIMEKMSKWLSVNNKKTETNSGSIVSFPSSSPSFTTENIPEESILSLFISKEDIARTVKVRGQTITFKNYPKAIRSRSLTEKNR